MTQQAIANTQNTFTLKDQRTFQENLQHGRISLQEYKNTFAIMRDSTESICAELRKLTKKDLAGMLWMPRLSDSKEELVKSVWRAAISLFSLSRGVSYMPFQGQTYDEAILKLVEATTEADLKDYAQKCEVRRQERIERNKVLEKSIKNPETLEEFENFVRIMGAAALTSEQKILRDELLAGNQKEKKEKALESRAVVSKIEHEGVEFTFKEGFHAKKKVPLYIVQLVNRVEREIYNELKIKAKRFGGWYSDFVKGCEGFQFEDRAAAESFMGLKEGAQSSADRIRAYKSMIQNNAVIRLRDMAESMTESANDDLATERKENTGRRADMAASARERAYSSIALAQTMNNIADAIESGESKHLSGIKHRTHIEALGLLVYRAKGRSGRINGEKHEEFSSRPACIADIEHAQYPYPSIYESHLRDALSFLQNRPGAMLLCNRVTKKLTGKQSAFIEFRTESDIRDLASLVQKMKQNKAEKWNVEKLSGGLEEYFRVKTMGLDTEPELRAALREYLTLRELVKQDSPIKKMERDLLGCKIPGYFPTPRGLAHVLLSNADIQEGNTILEPSAGKGNIADVIREVYPDHSLAVCEFNMTLKAILAAKNHDIVGGDFLELCGPWDRIIMNPPFENFQDVEHVRHAFDLLAPGGRLVAIMGEGSFFRQDKKAADFREWLEGVGGTSEQLPSDSFRDSERPTGVQTRMVVISK